jgi:hypothetical protein
MEKRQKSKIYKKIRVFRVFLCSPRHIFQQSLDRNSPSSIGSAQTESFHRVSRPRVKAYALPVPVRGLDAFPLRVVAIEP